MVPAATLYNAGRPPKEERLYLEGTSEAAGRLWLRVWSQGGTVLDASTGYEVEVDGDGARARQADGAWKAIPDFTDMVAPGSWRCSVKMALVNLR